MPRSRQRTNLESGLKLDLNKLRRQGLIRPGTKCGVVIRWANTYTGEEIAHGVITSNMYRNNFIAWVIGVCFVALLPSVGSGAVR